LSNPPNRPFTWNFNQLRSRGNQSHKIIVKWLKEREELFRLYFENVSSMPLPGNIDAQETWQAFGQVLMDYLSTGHFQIYSEFEKVGSPQSSIDQSILAELRETTEKFVDFHDKYFDLGPAEDNDELLASNNMSGENSFAQQLTRLFEGKTLSAENEAQLFAKLSQDLSNLGETLGNHVDLEDKLLAHYLRHATQILPSLILSRHSGPLTKSNEPILKPGFQNPEPSIADKPPRPKPRAGG